MIKLLDSIIRCLVCHSAELCMCFSNYCLLDLDIFCFMFFTTLTLPTQLTLFARFKLWFVDCHTCIVVYMSISQTVYTSRWLAMYWVIHRNAISPPLNDHRESCAKIILYNIFSFYVLLWLQQVYQIPVYAWTVSNYCLQTVCAMPRVYKRRAAVRMKPGSTLLEWLCQTNHRRPAWHRWTARKLDRWMLTPLTVNMLNLSLTLS